MQTHKAAPHHLEKHARILTPFCEIRSGVEGGAHVIHIEGELDHSDCPRLELALTDAEVSEASLVLVNCEELEFIDAAGLHSLFAASLRAADSGDWLRITRGSGGVAKMFKLTGLAGILPLVGCRNAA